MPENIHSFVEAVAAQIRWKKARAGLTEEIATHLLDQRDAYLAGGMTEEAAVRESLRQMGDPVVIGTELDRVHRPRPQWGLLLFAGVLLVAGALLRNSLTVPLRLDNSLFWDMLSIAAGIGCLAAGYLLDVTFLGKHIKLLFPGFFLALFSLMVFLPSVNAKAWLPERIMPLFPVLLAALMWSQKGKGWPGAVISLAGAGAGLCIAAVIPSLFTVFLVVLSALVLGLLFHRKGWFGVKRSTGVLLTILPGVSALGYFIWRSWGRWQVVFFPEADPTNHGYFAAAIRQALACARWLGPADVSRAAGYFQPALEQGYPLTSLVPEMEGVCLLVNLICKFGWLPFLALMAAFAGFFLWAFGKAVRLRQSLGQAVALAALTALLAQAGIGLLITLGMPVMTASFPLVVGNWATVVNMLLIGIMLSAFRDGALPENRRSPAKVPRYKLVIKLEKV